MRKAHGQKNADHGPLVPIAQSKPSTSLELRSGILCLVAPVPTMRELAQARLAMDEKALLVAITKSGWKGAWEEQVKGLASKLDFLKSSGRYGRLLTKLETANDKNNFAASVLEATIAFQFESRGIELEYEVRQDPNSGSSIDFRWTTASGRTVYIEVRLLQQDKATTDSIEGQLQIGNVYEISKDGDDEKNDIIRVQQAILGKVQKREGTPTKFLAMDNGAINVVAVDISQIILRMFDSEDCKLVALGDHSVQPPDRRSIFGLFQESMPGHLEHIRSLARSYDHIRNTLHGVLFLFRQPKTELFNYSIERFFVWNPRLINRDTARAICNQVGPALPLMKPS